MTRAIFWGQSFSLLATLAITAADFTLDTNRIEQITGLKGTLSAAEGVFKVTAPRTDLPITVDGWKMPPFMGLTTWAGFIQGKKAEAMGPRSRFTRLPNQMRSIFVATKWETCVC